MNISFPVLLFVGLLAASVSMIRRSAGTDKEDEQRLKKALRRMSMLIGCIFSGVVGLLVLRFDPQLVSSLVLKNAPQTETLFLTNSVELLFGTTSIPIIFDILFAHAMMVLCFLALPMMVGLGVVLLYPVFYHAGKATPTRNKFRNRIVISAVNVRRAFLVFSHLRN